MPNEESNFIRNYSEIFTLYWRNLKIGSLLQVLQQLCGINILLYYGPQILRDAGFGHMDDKQILGGFIVLGLISLAGRVFAMFTVDNLGRRLLMLRCLPFMALSMFAISLSMIMKQRYDYSLSNISS